MGMKTIGKFWTDVATPVAIAAGADVVFQGSSVCSGVRLANSGTDIQISVPGVYLVQFNATVTATAAANVEMQLTANGTARAGANAEATLAAVGDEAALSFSDVVTVSIAAPGNVAVLSVLNVLATSIDTANLVVMKVA